MKKFNIEIQEFLSRIIEIEAENIEDAILKVKKMYHNTEIVLDSSDYVTTSIEEFQEEI